MWARYGRFKQLTLSIHHPAGPQCLHHCPLAPTLGAVLLKDLNFGNRSLICVIGTYNRDEVCNDRIRCLDPWLRLCTTHHSTHAHMLHKLLPQPTSMITAVSGDWQVPVRKPSTSRPRRRLKRRPGSGGWGVSAGYSDTIPPRPHQGVTSVPRTARTSRSRDPRVQSSAIRSPCPRDRRCPRPSP